MLRKILAGVLAGIVVLALTVTTPPALVNNSHVPSVTGDLDEWLAAGEEAASATGPIIPGTEKRIRWYGEQKNSRSEYSIVYLHGLSATRQEIAPVAELIADALHANLFETRLAGHGLERNPLSGVEAEDWLADGAEALSIGARIGEHIILMGTSNGATLALAMAGHPTFEAVSTLVLLSPNLGPSDSKAELLTWPGGPQLAYLVAGETRSWTPHNALQARYWSTSYPMDAVVEMMRLVKFVRNKLPMQIPQAVLTIYSPADKVVDVNRLIAAFEQINSPRKELISIPGSGDPGNHVLAGDIMAPQNNQLIADDVVQFVRAGVQ